MKSQETTTQLTIAQHLIIIQEIGRWSSNAYLCIVYDCQESRTAAIGNGKLERRLFYDRTLPISFN